jgi:Histidine kinase N terminal
MVGGAMTVKQFTTSVRTDSLVIAQKWAKGVSNSKYTKTYRNLDEDTLVKIGKRVYDNLDQWLAPETPAEEIGKIYSKLGAERYEQGFPLCEITYAIHFVKKILLNHIFSTGIMPDTLKLYQTHDFVAKVHDFFDLASFYMARGFQESLYKRVSSLKGIDKDNIEKVFPAGSFYYELEPEFKTFERAMEGFNLFKVK